MRKILYVSGSRADYGPARRVLQAIQADPELELSILVAGMHLDPLHGETWREMAADGLTIADRVYGRVSGDSLTSMAASVGLYLYGMSQAMARIRPDIVLVLGDRGEQLAGAMAAAFQNIVVVHLCGGTISGSIDDSIRHAITKFAHYHLAAFEDAAQRIIQMGEDPATVRVVGLPGGDIRPDVTFTREQICAESGLSAKCPYLLVIQHPVSQSHADTKSQIIETLEAVAAQGLPALLANPNDDAGGRVVLAAMKEYAQRYTKLRILPPPASRQRFASVMAHAAVLVGNSSSAVAEAMSVGLPVVNIGDRQRGREHLACWINVGYDWTQIRRAIETALHGSDYRRRLADFASQMVMHNTAAQVVDCLRSVDLHRAIRPKPFVDLPISVTTRV